MQCPKCGHERSIQDDELTPKSDCPSCGIIYAKFKKKISAQKVSKQNLTESQVDNNSPEDEPVKFSYKYSGIAAFLIFCLFIYGAYSENTNKYNSTTSISNNSYVSHLPISSAAKWYENGTLHRANIQQWNRATFANQLATSADMAISHSKVSRKVKNSGDINKLRPYAVELLSCVNEASAGEGYETMKISEIAAMCVIMLKW